MPNSAVKKQATAYAPASVGNAAVGFDLVGFCFDVAGDEVTVERVDSPGVTVRNAAQGAFATPADASRNTAGAGLIALREDLQLAHGFAVTVKKGIALGSGMGGSAASAVAAIVAANAVLDEPLSQKQMLAYALIGESAATGGSFHADNVAPCLMGGLVCARVHHTNSKRPQVEATALPTPAEIWCALVKPNVALRTSAARGVLKAEVSLRAHVEQSARLAGFIAGCYQNKLSLIASSLEDVIIEPQRAHLIEGFAAVKAAAIESGALGCSIAGAGPSIFAWARGEEGARNTADAMSAAFIKKGIEHRKWTAPLPSPGARVIA